MLQRSERTAFLWRKKINSIIPENVKFCIKKDSVLLTKAQHKTIVNQ